jgi:hypothetical protein
MISDISKNTPKIEKIQNPPFIEETGAETLENFCKNSNRAPIEVWEDIRAGKIEAREIGGEVFIIVQNKRVVGAEFDPEELPSLWREDRHFLSLSGASGKNPEVALLIDHLSLAKEENREILAFAQKSLEQVREITTQIVTAKDELLRVKEEKISLLEKRISQLDSSMRQLSQEKEDLEMLTKALTGKS